MTSPWGTTSYTYDALNRLSSLTNPDGKIVTFGYDALGRRTRLTYPNGTETTYAYDAASQLTQVLHRKIADSTALAFNNYGYDLAGNRTSMQDLTGNHGYGYDDLHRLTSASHPSLPNETFAYDAVGNRLNDAVMANYQYNAANRLLENSSYTYTYDNNGNLTGQTHKITSDHTAYAYTTENQLRQATLPDSTQVTFKYDPLGRRIEKVTPQGTFRYVYDNDDVIAVLDSNNQAISQLTHGPYIDEPLVMKASDGNSYFYHADGIGSIVALTAENGSIQEAIEYQAFGGPVFKDATGALIPDSAIGNIYSYTAREYDAELALFYYRARHYDPVIGRFIQADPVGFAGGDVNFYAYVGGNPLAFNDPYGLAAIAGGYKDMMRPAVIGYFSGFADLYLNNPVVDFVTSQGFVDFSAGVGDVALLGFGDDIRQALGIDNVDECSGYYTAGTLTWLGIPTYYACMSFDLFVDFVPKLLDTFPAASA